MIKTIFVVLFASIFLMANVSAFQYSAFVNDDTLWGIKDAKVKIYDSHNKLLIILSTNAEGYTPIVNLPYGDYTVRVGKKDYMCPMHKITLKEDLINDFFKCKKLDTHRVPNK